MICRFFNNIMISFFAHKKQFQRKEHSGLIRNLINLKGKAKGTAQDEQVCLKDSKYILFEILEN